VQVIAEIPDQRAWGDARLDLEIVVPAGVAVKIDDGSGSLRARKVASLEIEDGSGEMEIEDVAGDVAIDDGSGTIRVRDVGGDFTVRRDGSGGIHHEGVAGRVSVPERDR